MEIILLPRYVFLDGGLMKTILNILAVLFLLSGAVWFLQGINILPGSFMRGDIHWSIYGGIVMLVSIFIIILVNRRKGTHQK